MAEEPAASSASSQERGWLDKARANTWASLGILIGLWILLTPVAFFLVAFPTQNFTIATLLGPVLALAGAVAIGYWQGFLQRVDRARHGAPLWVRLLIPIPIGLLFFFLFLVAIGSLIEVFTLMILTVVALTLAATGALVWFAGLWEDVPRRVRDAKATARLGTLAGAGLAGGLLAFLLVLMLYEQAAFGLAAFLPAALLTIGAVGWFSGWWRDAFEVIVSWHFAVRHACFAVLTLLLTFYFSLLIGPFFALALFGYAVSLAAALVILVPLSIWVHAWRDLWTWFVELGEGNRVLAVLPAFPVTAAFVFIIIAALTDSFEAAYIASVPAGLVAFLLVGLPFGVTQEIPDVVRRQALPQRSAIFLGAFAVLAAYAYFAIALIIQDVELSLIGGMLFAGIVLGVVSEWLRLGEGLGDEFESYGALGEAAILGIVFVFTLAAVFTVIALAVGDFRLAFLVSVAAAAGMNYLIAHSTGLIGGMREAIGKIPWWADLFVLGGVFVLSLFYGTLAVGVFIDNAPIAFAAGGAFALVAVLALSQDLDVGTDLLETADERRAARLTILTLAFLGGFLVALYASAAALQVAGNDLFGFPFFIALFGGTAALLAVASYRGWDDDVLGRVRTTGDLLKVSTILALWLAVGILTGFALQSLPVDGQDIGLGMEVGLPLSLTLAAGLLVWAWIPIVLFRLVAVERTPMQATFQMEEKHRLLASIGWGLLTGAVVLVILLTLYDEPPIAFGVAIAAGYVAALVMSIWRRRHTTENP